MPAVQSAITDAEFRLPNSQMAYAQRKLIVIHGWIDIFANGRSSRNFDLETLASAHGVIDAGSLVLRRHLGQQAIRLAAQALKTKSSRK